MKHVEERILACLEGRLPKEQAETVRAHCRDCPHCAEAWARTETAWAALAACPAPPAPAPAWPGVRARLRLPERRTRGFAFGAAATAAIGLAIGLLLSAGTATQAPPAGDAATAVELLAEGTLWWEGRETTLDVLYLAAGANGDDGGVQ